MQIQYTIYNIKYTIYNIQYTTYTIKMLYITFVTVENVKLQIGKIINCIAKENIKMQENGVP